MIGQVFDPLKTSPEYIYSGSGLWEMRAIAKSNRQWINVSFNDILPYVLS